MKKYKSFIPTLGAALLLSLGSAFCAQAADIGWVTEDGTWRYKDASGNYVTNTWKTSGDSSFYLGSDGKMTVNQWIDDDYPVSYSVYPTEEALRQGAVGAFGERYGSEVKVYSIGTPEKRVSFEVCGGPHVEHTGVLGEDVKRFKITKEESSSAGIRRIKAVLQ